MGIDVSLSETGIALLDVEKGRVIFVLVKGKKEESSDAKMLKVVKEVSKILSPEDIVVLEDFSIIGHYRVSGRSTERSKLLGMLMQAVFSRTGRLPLCIHPLRLKRFVSGTGKAEKAEMVSALCHRFKIVTGNHNLADAAGLALMGYFLLNPERDCLMIDGLSTLPLDDSQKDVLRKEAEGNRLRMAV